MNTDNKNIRRYHVYKTQLVVEYLGVVETEENIHKAKLIAEKEFNVKSSVIKLCDVCKRLAMFTDRPRVLLNEIKKK